MSDKGRIVAQGAITGATGARLNGFGFTSSRAAAGDYTITLSVAEGTAIDDTELAFGLACGDAANVRIPFFVPAGSDTAKRILVTDAAGANADCATLYFTIWRPST